MPEVVTIATIWADKEAAAEFRYQAADRLRVCQHFKLMVTASESLSRPGLWLIQASERGERHV